jgi:hypothetical protein
MRSMATSSVTEEEPVKEMYRVQYDVVTMFRGSRDENECQVGQGGEWL